MKNLVTTSQSIAQLFWDCVIGKTKLILEYFAKVRMIKANLDFLKTV